MWSFSSYASSCYAKILGETKFQPREVSPKWVKSRRRKRRRKRDRKSMITMVSTCHLNQNHSHAKQVGYIHLRVCLRGGTSLVGTYGLRVGINRHLTEILLRDTNRNTTHTQSDMFWWVPHLNNIGIYSFYIFLLVGSKSASWVPPQCAASHT